MARFVSLVAVLVAALWLVEAAWSVMAVALAGAILARFDGYRHGVRVGFDRAGALLLCEKPDRAG